MVCVGECCAAESPLFVMVRATESHTLFPVPQDCLLLLDATFLGDEFDVIKAFLDQFEQHL